MFGLGTSELIFILVIVLLIYGPDRLPEMARKVGKISRDLKQMGDGVRTMVQQEINKVEAPIQKLEEETRQAILSPLTDDTKPPDNDGNPPA